MSAYIGKNIKAFRQKLGLSQAEVAEYCGIQREMISYYENGTREVSLLHLEKIAEFLNIDMDTFLEENPVDIQPDLALAFRANDLSAADRDSIAYFKRIVKNYLKMKNIETNGTSA